ncbi:MAG: cytochrome C oxidase subunit IV family protein [Planctomycetota bacterium]|jgi:cytochrome c oxidase subunit 4
MASEVEGIRKHVRAYLIVFAALAGLTVVTVAVSFLNVSTAAAIAIALSIATVKGTLVACFFMHLISERMALYSILILSAVFLLAVMLLPVVTQHGTVTVGNVS